ncbi:hypothetical protein FI667_g7156, partial [Globisporangium splendens]
MNVSSSNQKKTDLDVYAVPITPDENAQHIDMSTFQRNKWSHSLNETGAVGCDCFEGRYMWCSCFVWAQIESRIGYATYESALSFHLGLPGVGWVLVIIGLAWLLCVELGSADVTDSFTMIWVGCVLFYVIVAVTWSLLRMMSVRHKVRERFGIPDENDCWPLTGRRAIRGMRQLTLHLQIDQVGIFDRVDTLPAYEN